MKFTDQSYGTNTRHKCCWATHRLGDSEEIILCCIKRKAADLINIHLHTDKVCECGSVAIGLAQIYSYDDEKLTHLLGMLEDLEQDILCTDGDGDTRYYKALKAIAEYIVRVADEAYARWYVGVDDAIAALNIN